MTRRTPAQYDWARALFSDRRLSKHFTSPRRSNIKTVTLHHSTIVGNGNAAALESMYRVWQSRQASANYGVDGAHVWQYVSDNDAAWANATSSNHETLSIEHTNSTGAPSWQISDQTMASGAHLVAALHVLYSLGRPTRRTVKVHRDYFATACPGPYMMAHLSAHIADAARVYDLMKAGKPVAPPSPTPTPTPTPPVATWGKPDTFVLGATGPEVTRLGQRLEVHAAADKRPAPYVFGPGPNYTATDRAAVADFQRAQGWTGDDADGFPGPETLKRLAAEPAPAAKTQTLRVLFLPMAGYNGKGAPGATRWKANTDGLASIVNNFNPHLFGTTELSNKVTNRMRPRFDKATPRHARDKSGSDGRYAYRNTGGMAHIASGVVSAAKGTLFNGDTKQAAWRVDRSIATDTPVAIISCHTENEDGRDKRTGKNADNLRVDQALSMVDQSIAKIKAAAPDITDDHIIVVGDFNSQSMVRDVMVGKGWTPVGPGHFTRWDDTAAKPFDWAFIKAPGTATFERLNHKFSDHTALLIQWTFPV